MRLYGDSFLDALSNMPVAYTPDYGWELHDMTTGEIFQFATYRAANDLRHMAIQKDMPIYDLYSVRIPINYAPYNCLCCHLPLRDEELNYCHFCVSEGCNA